MVFKFISSIHCKLCDEIVTQYPCCYCGFYFVTDSKDEKVDC